MASAFTSVDGDPDLAAQLIAGYSNNIVLPSTSPAPRAHPHLSTHPIAGKKSQAAPRFSNCSASTRLGGPSSATLVEYFPPPPDRNAWSEPLTRAATQSQDPPNDCEKVQAFDTEFPSLRSLHSISDRSSSVSSRRRPSGRSAKGGSVACGLISNARTRRLRDPPPTEKVLREGLLLSMLGDGFELGIDAMRDVLGHYEGDVEQACTKEADEGANPSTKRNQIKQSRCLQNQTEKYQALEEEMLKQEHSNMKWVVDRLCKEFPTVDMDSLREVLRAIDFNYSDAEKMLQEAGMQELSEEHGGKDNHVDLSNLILESLFKPHEDKEEDSKEYAHLPPPKEHKKNMEAPLKPEWKVVTSLEPHMPANDNTTVHVKSYGNWDDYERHHQSAKQHWQTMEQYLKAAATALAEGDLHRADLLSEKGNTFKQLAAEARERANSFLLQTKNLDNENDFTLDLQEQNVGGALQLLKLHLKTLSPVPSCQKFSIITGPKRDPTSAHMKVRQAVIHYLKKNEVEWIEMTPFFLQVTPKKDVLQD